MLDTKSLPLLGLLIVSVTGVLLTLLIPVSVIDQAGLSDVWLGVPFRFLQQNFGSLDPPSSSFPFVTAFASPWEYPVNVHWPFFFLNVFIVFAVLFVIYTFVQKKKKYSR